MRDLPPCEILCETEKLCLLKSSEEEGGGFQYELTRLSWKSSGFSLSKKITSTNNIYSMKNIEMLYGTAILEVYWIYHRIES